MKIRKKHGVLLEYTLLVCSILPLVFADPADYDTFELCDELIIENAREQVAAQHAEDAKAPAPIIVKNLTKNLEYKMISNSSDYEIKMILNGGKINSIKAEA